MNHRFPIVSIMLSALLLAGCSAQRVSETGSAVKASAANTDAVITLAGSTAESNSENVSISGGVITITGAGSYEITGTLDEGMVIVDAGDEDDVDLVLNGAAITSATSAAIYVANCDDAAVTLAAGSANTLSNGGSFEAIDDKNIDSVIFSREDLLLTGDGSLTVQSPAGHGIVSKNDLVVESGSITIEAASHGMTGKDAVQLDGGTVTITAGKDGIQADNDEDETLGNLTVTGGSYAITAAGDGMSASGDLAVEAGELTITAGGGAASVTHTEAGFGWQGQTSNTDSASAKGLKADGDLTVAGGTITADTADDSLHANGDLAVTGGELTLSSGDDGIHADGSTTISAGTVNIPASYEGIEGQTITISGGAISVVSSDDGLNAAGGSDQSGGMGFFGGDDPFQADASAEILISGGTILVNADGDGIDSNGTINMTGGQVFVSGPTNAGNGALDYNGTATITGGTIIAAGASGMAENFSSAENQGVMLVSTGAQRAGSTIQLTDASGNVLLSWAPEKAYECVVISSPDVQQGGTYTLTADSSTQTVEMTSAVYGAGSGMGMGGHGGMNQMGGQMGQMPQGGQMGQMPQGGQMSGGRGQGQMPGRP